MRHKVVALAYDRLCTFEFGCTVELFALPRPELGVPWYEFLVCALERGPLRAAGGVELRVRQPLRLLDSADTIIIPGWRDPEEAPPPLLLAILRRALARGARLCSICSGVFVLAAAGVLDGRRATTHWRYVAQLAARYPRIRVEPNALYVDEGRVLTSAGSAAGLDMLLHLVRSDFGARIANQVAQRLVVAPHREGDQAQFVPRPLAADGRGRLARLMDFVRAHPGAPHTLASLAARARDHASHRAGHRDARRPRQRRVAAPPLPPAGRRDAGAVSPAFLAAQLSAARMPPASGGRSGLSRRSRVLRRSRGPRSP